MEEQQLSVGVLGKQDIYLHLVSELLNQQGIIFEIVKQDTNSIYKYPCVILINGDKNKTGMAQSCYINGKSGIFKLNINNSELYHTLSGVDDTRYLSNTLYEPTTTKYGAELAEKIKQIYHNQNLPFVQKWFWPDFAGSCCIITHDIDSLNHPPNIRKNTLEWIRYAYYRLIKNETYGSNIANIVQEETGRDIRSSFYFFSDYGQYQRDFIKSLERIKKTGSEIGLHGSLNSFQSPVLLKQEIEELEKLTKTKVHGERQHTLNFLVPHTWRYYDEIGLDYDLTFYYNDKFGFRAGVCHPYHPFDALTYKKFNIVEIPTSFMDYTAIFQRLSLYEQENVLSELKRVVEKYHGCLVLNFHNMYITERHYPDIVKLYRSTLDYVKQNDYWIATAHECAQWWRKRESVKIDLSIREMVLYGKTSNAIPLHIEMPNGKIKKVHVNQKFTLGLDSDQYDTC